MLADEKSGTHVLLVKLFTVVPFLALVTAIPFAWGWGLSWTDIALAVTFYGLTCLGITVGFHRYLTHGAFKASRGMRIALTVAGSMAMEGPVIDWVADHRRPARTGSPASRSRTEA